MAVILNIETATQICSVAVSENNSIIGSKTLYDEKSHASQLAVIIDELLMKHKLTPDAVAVSMGPGSYTGLRIGVSTAKGIAYGLNIPLLAVSTLQAMAKGVVGKLKSGEIQAGIDISEHNILLCPMIDARRMEVYTAFYDISNKPLKEISADIINSDSYIDILENNKVIFFGNGASKCKEVIQHTNAVFIDNIETNAEYLVNLAHEQFDSKKFEDVAYFEPFYLKDFVATVPKNKVLQQI